MKILLAGGHSSLAKALCPILTPFADVLTAGRNGCDVELDHSWPAERFALPAGLDAVVNLAAHFGGPNFDGMLAAEEVNTLGALKLAHACTMAGVAHMLLVSSVHAELTEDSPFFNSYALSKRHSEDLTSLYCRSTGLPLTILRPARLYGEGESFRRHQPFLYALMDRAQCGEDIVLNGKNDARRNFIHIEDVAEVLARLVLQRIEGRYVCANMSTVSISEIASAAVAAFGSASHIRFNANKPDVPDDLFMADAAFYDRIGFFPRISLAHGLEREAARRMALP